MGRAAREADLGMLQCDEDNDHVLNRYEFADFMARFVEKLRGPSFNDVADCLMTKLTSEGRRPQTVAATTAMAGQPKPAADISC